MSIRALAISALLLSAGTSTFAGAADAPWTYTATVRIAVDTGGHAKVLRFTPEVPKGLIASTTAKIEGWEFEPARHDGIAVGSETNLFVRYDVRKVAEGYAFDIAGVDVGAGIGKSEMPRYPAAAIQNHVAGTVHLKVDIDEQGVPTRVVDIGDKKLRYLSDAAVEAVRRWRFEPQRVDGIAIVEPLFVPIEFKLIDGNTRPTILQEKAKADASPPLPPSDQLVGSEQPVVKLLTRL